MNVTGQFAAADFDQVQTLKKTNFRGLPFYFIKIRRSYFDCKLISSELF